jgi:hypothetical protein
LADLGCANHFEDIRVIDGDTIRVYQKQPNVWLVGFNAPETRRAASEAEREVGAKATRRVRDLVRDGNLDFQFVACSCPRGTEGTPACNYGRRCGANEKLKQKPQASIDDTRQHAGLSPIGVKFNYFSRTSIMLFNP